MTAYLHADTVSAWLADGQEIALLDVREHGQYGEGHPFLAVNLPYSRLEIEAPALLPRLDARLVLLDDGDGVAELAAAALAVQGYGNLHLLQDGAPGWQAAGHTLFKGVNVPSKTFGELVEHHAGTPQVSAETLRAWQAEGRVHVLLDGRTLAEHRKQTIPGAIPVPNGELALRIGALLSGPDEPVVVHCAGRTRSIIGAQTLRDLGLPNPVYALENGTQGWQLAGFALERGSTREVPARPSAVLSGQVRARALASAHGVPRLDATQAQGWLDDATRTTYVLDVRTDSEFAAATLPGARHAPGGQLVQATDHYIAVRHARVLLLDDDGIRAPLAAAWLRRLGFESAVVEDGIHAALRVPHRQAARLPVAPGEWQAGDLRAQALPRILDARGSLEYRRAHPAGAVWTTRSRAAHALQGESSVLLLAPDAAVAALLAATLKALGATVQGWTTWAAWQASGLPRAASPGVPDDRAAIDTLFFVHDRHDGNLDAARAYLAWETALIGQCSAQELAQFRLDPARGVALA